MTRCSRWKCQNVKTLQSMTTIECNNVTLKQSFAILISIFGIALKITSELFLSTPNNYRISKYVSCTILFLMKCSLASWNRVKLVSNLNNETRELFHDVTSWCIFPWNWIWATIFHKSLNNLHKVNMQYILREVDN